jgi:hypothetical protein
MTPPRRILRNLAGADVDPGRVLAVSCAAFLAAVFLVFDAPDADEPLERRFRGARSAALVTSALALGVFVVRGDAAHLYHGSCDGLPLAIVSGLRRCRHRAAAKGFIRGTRPGRGRRRLMLAAWGVAQSPYITTSLTFAAAAGARTLGWVIAMTVFASVPPFRRWRCCWCSISAAGSSRARRWTANATSVTVSWSWAAASAACSRRGRSASRRST